MLSRTAFAVAHAAVAYGLMMGAGFASVLTLDTFNSGSQSLLLSSTSGTTRLQVTGTAATLSGDRDIQIEVASALSSGQDVQAEVSPSAGVYTTLVTGAAPLTDLAITWGATTWAPAGGYDFAAAIGSSAYQGYTMQIDYSAVQFPAGSRTLLFEITTAGGGSAVYQALVPASPTSGTAILSYTSHLGTPDLTKVTAMGLTVQVPAGTGTATTFQLNEIRLVPEPSTLIVAGLGCGIGAVWVGCRARREKGGRHLIRRATA